MRAQPRHLHTFLHEQKAKAIFFFVFAQAEPQGDGARAHTRTHMLYHGPVGAEGSRPDR